MQGQDPFTDIQGAPVPIDDDDVGRSQVVDWRILLVVLGLFCVVLFTWTNWESRVPIQFFCVTVEMSVVWVIVVSLVVGAVVALAVEAGYRRFRSHREAAVKAAENGEDTES